jgi:hypothetical protein
LDRPKPFEKFAKKYFISHLDSILHGITIFGIQCSYNFIVDEVDFSIGKNAVYIKNKGADVIESLFVTKHF